MMSNRFAEVIQPESLRSPEVLIRAEWDTRPIFGTFADILSFMLTINPQERWSAAQLLDYSWLKNVD